MFWFQLFLLIRRFFWTTTDCVKFVGLRGERSFLRWAAPSWFITVIYPACAELTGLRLPVPVVAAPENGGPCDPYPYTFTLCLTAGAAAFSLASVLLLLPLYSFPVSNDPVFQPLTMDSTTDSSTIMRPTSFPANNCIHALYFACVPSAYGARPRQPSRTAPSPCRRRL